MKKQCNFYKRNYSLLYIVFLCLTTLFTYGQTDSLSVLKKEKSKKELENSLIEYNKRQENAVSRFLKQGYKKIIETKDGEYSELIGENALGKPLYFITHNNKVVTALQANVLQSGFDGINLEGEGIKIGLWENGQPRRAHELFRTTVSPALLQSRIQYVSGQNATLQRHATHVAGTIIGNQYLPSTSSPSNSLVRGVAYKGTIKAWDWLNVPTEMTTAATTDNIKIANTSFGLNPIYMHASEFGRYNEIAQQWDDVMCINKEFQIVKSVGNARDDLNTNGFPQYPQVTILGGYDLLEGAGVAKNVLVVGAVNLAGKTPPYVTTGTGINSILETYNSWGATDDGRIKPDVVTHGNNVFSSIETQNNTYGYYSGTSQAAAGVTGGIALLHNYWNSKFLTTMWSSTVRALLIHSIDEIDEKGPDYRNGWGVVNLHKAADVIKERGKSVIIREDVLQNGETVRINLAATGQEDLKVTLAWTDPAGDVVLIDVNNPNASINETTAKLVNDLDIKLIRKDASGNDDTTLVDPTLNPPSPDTPTSLNLNSNNVLYPWVLKQQIATCSISDLSSKAQRGINDRDNIEKIEVYQNLIPPTGGMFQLQISHKGTITDACQTGQPYSLIISGVSFCSDDLVFLQHQDDELTDNTETTVLANTIKASNIIRAISSFQVTNPDFVEYRAADYIELLPQSENGGTGTEGFTAEYGSDFLAHLPCSGINERTAFSPNAIESFKNDTKVNEHIIVEKGEVVIFPNPYINDILNIQFRLVNTSTFEIQIFDLTGKLVYQDKDKKEYTEGIHKKAIDANFLPSGTFIIKTISSDGISSIKLIKK
jgi:serine protease AprX